MTSIGVPIHCAASEPEIDAFRKAARPASNAATHASRVSRSVPSMSKRTARSLDVPRLRAVLFDIDGTLLDTRDAWAAAFDAGLAALRKAWISGLEAAQWICTGAGERR